MSATHESTISAEIKARALDVLRTLPADWSLHTAWYESAEFREIAVALDATVVSGLRHDGSAEYAFERDPEGMERTYKFDGVRWREIRRNAETGRWIITDNTSLRIGSRSEYYDPIL